LSDSTNAINANPQIIEIGTPYPIRYSEIKSEVKIKINVTKLTMRKDKVKIETLFSIGFPPLQLNTYQLNSSLMQAHQLHHNDSRY
jgi:hypothetical protein